MSDQTDESAKAAQEIAKTGGKGIDATRALGEFVAKFIGAPLEQASGIVADKLHYMRWERQIRLIVRAEKFLKERGLDAPTKAVPIKVAIPLFRAAWAEENDELQDMWARLLASAADAHSDVEVTRGLVSILQDFGPMEARVIESIYYAPPEHSPNGVVTTECLPEGYGAPGKSENSDAKLPREEVQIALWHLKRLGCIDAAGTWDSITGIERVRLTELGRTLVHACTNKQISRR
jgi:hypothetical protein